MGGAVKRCGPLESLVHSKCACHGSGEDGWKRAQRERAGRLSYKRKATEGVYGAVPQVLCARRDWTIVEPEFSRDTSPIYHTTHEVVTLEYATFVAGCEKGSLQRAAGNEPEREQTGT